MSTNESDTEQSLQQIAHCHGRSIISLLIDIQECKVEQKIFLPFLKNLECLRPHRHKPTLLCRQRVDAFENPSYVALSYPWDGCKFEDLSHGRYKVQSRDRGRTSFDSSEVRDCVFDRILKYMHRFRLKLLWIDRHSIRQQTCDEVECGHLECSQKREGIKAMDLVYKHSDHPVALLATPVEARNDLKLLVRILSGDLVSTSRRKPRFRLSEKTNAREATDALMLLKKLTSDRWWTRGWVFQESYRGGAAMLKRSFGTTLFNDICAELCIDLVKFSYEATRLCLAFQGVKFPSPQTQQAISQITTTAGRYTLLLEKHESMSPTIISDIGKRDIKQQWDRLAIAANCCQYSTRLDVRELQQKEHSVSLSMLALWLLNGEIFRNKKATAPPSQMTVLEFITSHSFKGFYAPLSRHSLTFNKGCRFPDAKLTPRGVLTRGHLWKLGRPIHPREINRQPSWVDDPTGKISLHDRKRLTQLANMLRVLRHFALEGQLRKFLKRDARGECDDRFADTFAGSYMRTMASEIADAIDQGLTLRLACMWEPSTRRSSYRSSYRGIFICNDDDGDVEFDKVGLRRSVQANGPSLIFTASCPKSEGSAVYQATDLDRHVSLEVQQLGSVREANRIVPQLQVGRWVLGLCFFGGFETTSVLFPWPPGLEAIVP
ncbi:hypothetical protein MRS44_018201 [Fusarium solani]|uniref:uncharacterized protein n=1 Tax=Fusarium solani TaxID=169388 RepID=UPI0032C47DEF|nr:hypothetical protein MRS44_018201 [Fusarium solani]